jgi:hypothetical protein
MPDFYCSFKKRKEKSRINVWVACMNARQSQVAILLLLTFRQEALSHLPRFNGRGTPQMETYLIYTDSLKNDFICNRRLSLHRLLKNVML